MSKLCIVNLKKFNMQIDGFNELANRLVGIALTQKIAVLFGGCIGGVNKIVNGLENYFTISNTFLCQDSNNLGWASLFDLQPLILKICNGNECGIVEKDSEFRAEFKKKYYFFNAIFDCIFEYSVSEIEIYFIENASFASDIDDYEVVYTNTTEFLDRLFDSIEDELDNNFNYSIPVKRYILMH